MAKRSTIQRFFGRTYPLVEHVVQLTAVFAVILLCLFVARQLIPLLFPPGQYLSKMLHVVDLYAATLGTIGYVVWLTLDMYALLLRRIREEKEAQDNEKS